MALGKAKLLVRDNNFCEAIGISKGQIIT